MNYYISDNAALLYYTVSWLTQEQFFSVASWLPPLKKSKKLCGKAVGKCSTCQRICIQKVQNMWVKKHIFGNLVTRLRF